MKKETNSKICSKCNTEKHADEFYKHKAYMDGRCNQCKDCMNEYSKKRYKNKINTDSEFRRKRTEYNHSDAKKRSQKKYEKSEGGKNKRTKLVEKYKEDGRLSEYNKKYYSSEKGKAAVKRASVKNAKDPQKRLRGAFSVLIRSCLRDQGLTKAGLSAFDFLPYTKDELIAHLENNFEAGMVWDNYGNGDNCWSLDHTVAQSKFFFSSFKDGEFQKCWALSNLRPMWHKDNISKGSLSLEEWALK